MHLARYVRTLFTAGVVATAALAGPAAEASAAVTEVGVSGGFGLGFLQYGTGCTYTVTVHGTPGDAPVTLSDQAHGGPGATFGPVAEHRPGLFTADWTPNVTGRHTLSAGPGPGAFTEVYVGVGYDFGLICATLPEHVRLPF